MPAYHVVAGNPARPLRKVSLDVPDARGFRYRVDDTRALVLHDDTDNRPMSVNVPRRDFSVFDEASQAERDFGEILEEMKAVKERYLAVDLVMLMISVLVIWWILHSVLY